MELSGIVDGRPRMLSLFATSMFARAKVAVKVMLAVEVLAANPAPIHYERRLINFD
jgi:hypothetical protein